MAAVTSDPSQEREQRAPYDPMPHGPDEVGVDPAAWMRGLTQRRVSRRDAFRYAGAGAGALSFASILAGASGVASAAPEAMGRVVAVDS